MRFNDAPRWAIALCIVAIVVLPVSLCVVLQYLRYWWWLKRQQAVVTNDLNFDLSLTLPAVATKSQDGGTGMVAAPRVPSTLRLLDEGISPSNSTALQRLPSSAFLLHDNPYALESPYSCTLGSESSLGVRSSVRTRTWPAWQSPCFGSPVEQDARSSDSDSLPGGLCAARSADLTQSPPPEARKDS